MEASETFQSPPTQPTNNNNCSPTTTTTTNNNNNNCPPNFSTTITTTTIISVGGGDEEGSVEGGGGYYNYWVSSTEEGDAEGGEVGEGYLLSTRPEFTIPLSTEVLIAVGVYLLIVGLISTVGNSVFLLVLRRRLRVLRDGQTVLLMNAALCDLAISLTGYPYSVVSAFYGSWVFGDLVCRMYAFLCFTLNEVQMNTLVVIAMFRYVTVCRPQFKYLLTPRLAGKCLVVVWLYCLAWTIAPLLGWSRYVLEPSGVSCSTDWFDTSPAGVAYSLCLIIFCFLVQVVGLGVCYTKILKTSSRLQPRPLSTSNQLHRHNTITSQQENHMSELDLTEGVACCHHYICMCEATFRSDIEKHVLWVNLLMVLSFIFFWTPYALTSIVSVFKSDLSAFWYIFPTVFAKTSCMMNPLIYGLSHRLLYRELVLLLGRPGCFCCLDGEDGDNTRKLDEMRRKVSDGTYDKEGVYVGKVQVGLCTCNGCAMSRREMIVLARLQKKALQEKKNNKEQPEETQGIAHCSISLVEDVKSCGTTNISNKHNSTPNNNNKTNGSANNDSPGNGTNSSKNNNKKNVAPKNDSPVFVFSTITTSSHKNSSDMGEPSNNINDINNDNENTNTTTTNSNTSTSNTEDNTTTSLRYSVGGPKDKELKEAESDQVVCHVIEDRELRGLMLVYRNWTLQGYGACDVVSSSDATSSSNS
ncbi:hypothetical protein Pmani_019875 [Petrolisthes manimaculis]|uniref:G-protein coupled receptors family 1 profile domain-containing protein n=1 Tax=Petrolisthes manimaculis TaxID=1843537 RepID=A0AAE1PJV3_9EUCA|nr:hypothetical protein Pmani_019875 [Petrolisthes manimaculis]